MTNAVYLYFSFRQLNFGDSMPIEKFESDASDIRERVIWFVRQLGGKPVRYKAIEEHLGVSARKWQNLCNYAQQPSIEMLQAIGKHYPQYSEWLVTGVTTGRTQKDPAFPAPPSGEIDLSLLEEPMELIDIVPAQDELSDDEIRKLTDAFFSQLTERKRKK